MTQKIIFKNLDGSIGIIHPSLKCELSIQEIAKKDVLSGLSYTIVDESEIPEDRQYRGAWVADENYNIVHDLDKAKEIHKNILRTLRAPKLSELDIEYQKADEKQDLEKKQEIATKKQELRDVTKDESVLNATSIEELKLAIPEILKD